MDAVLDDQIPYDFDTEPTLDDGPRWATVGLSADKSVVAVARETPWAEDRFLIVGMPYIGAYTKKTELHHALQRDLDVYQVGPQALVAAHEELIDTDDDAWMEDYVDCDPDDWLGALIKHSTDVTARFRAALEAAGRKKLEPAGVGQELAFLSVRAQVFEAAAEFLEEEEEDESDEGEAEEEVEEEDEGEEEEEEEEEDSE